MRVLIADDSAPTLRGQRLRELVLGATSIHRAGETGAAPTAIDAIERLQPDVVILDLRTPGGWLRLLQAVRAH